MKMLERAAEAVWDACPDLRYHAREVVTCAVLRSIREPDETVIEAMAERFARTQECWDTADCDADACECRKSALAIWQAGVDKALEERE